MLYVSENFVENDKFLDNYPQKYLYGPKFQKGPWEFFFKYTFLEPSRGPLSIATIVGNSPFQKLFDPKSEP